MRIVKKAAGSALIFMLAGCVGTPSLNLAPPADGDPATASRGRVHRIVTNVLCELAEAKGKNPGFSNYVGVAQLTLKAEDTGGLTPSLTLINPLAIATTSRSKGLGGEFTQGRLRSFSHNFVIDIDSLSPTCSGGAGSSLTGELGLDEVVRGGLSGASVIGAMAGTWPGKKDDAHFGSIIQFTSKIGVNGALSVTKTDIRGYGGTNGLANMSRTGTDTLTITFARKGVGTAADKSALSMLLLDPELSPEERRRLVEEAQQARAYEEAEAAARALLNRMLLENLNLFQQ